MAFICATCHLIFDHKVEKHHISDTKLVCESVLTKKIRNYSGHLKLQSHFRKLVTGNWKADQSKLDVRWWVPQSLAATSRHCNSSGVEGQWEGGVSRACSWRCSVSARIMAGTAQWKILEVRLVRGEQEPRERLSHHREAAWGRARGGRNIRVPPSSHLSSSLCLAGSLLTQDLGLSVSITQPSCVSGQSREQWYMALRKTSTALGSHGRFPRKSHLYRLFPTERGRIQVLTE